MKRLLLCLVPWMVSGLAAGYDDPRPATVSFTHAGLARDLIWRVGDECHISPWRMKHPDARDWNLPYEMVVVAVQDN